METLTEVFRGSGFRSWVRLRIGLLVGAGALWVVLAPQTPSAHAQSGRISINFQPAGIPIPAGHLPDSGLIYGDRGNGYSYGWKTNHSSRTKYYPPPIPWANLRYWTLIEMMSASTTAWEIGIANGTHQITIGAGGPVSPGDRQQIRAEGVVVVDDMPTDYNSWVGGTALVTVSDGRLTVTNAPGATKNFITFIDIAAQ
jgi:hypothetical protein